MLNKSKALHLAIIILSILSLFLFNVSLAQTEVPTVEAPETLEEAKGLGERFFTKSQKELPQIIERLWREEVLPVWKNMYQVWSDWWDSYIQPRIESLWQKFLTLMGQEIERRKPQVEEELEKEKEELKEEIETGVEKTKKSLWERFKELIRKN